MHLALAVRVEHGELKNGCNKCSLESERSRKTSGVAESKLRRPSLKPKKRRLIREKMSRIVKYYLKVRTTIAARPGSWPAVRCSSAAYCISEWVRLGSFKPVVDCKKLIKVKSSCTMLAKIGAP